MGAELNGLTSLSYMGVQPTTPPMVIYRTFSPNANDNQNFNLGAIWLNTTTQAIFMLTSLAKGIAVWTELSTGPAGTVDSLTGNDAVVVSPLAGNINVVGDGTYVTTAGTPNTLTVSLVSHSVTLSNGSNITVTGSPLSLGGTATIAVSGTTNHAVQIGNVGGSLTSLSVGTNGQVLIGSTAANPSFVTPTAGTGLSITTNATTLAYALSTPVSVANGGTGASTFTANGVLYGNGTSPLGVTAAGTNGQVLTGVTAGAPVWASPASSSITITGDSGGGLTGNSFTFTGGTTGLTFAGAGTTETLGGTLVVSNGGTGASTLTGVLIGSGTSSITGNAVTQYNVLVGGASNAISSIAPSATVGVPLVSAGAAVNPSFGTAVVAGGGTGATSFTVYAPVCGGTSTTGALQSASTGISNSGYVLTSTGAASLPTWQVTGAAVSGSIIGLNNCTLNITGTVGYIGFYYSAGTASASLSAIQIPVPMNGTIDHMYVLTNNNSNSINGTYTLNVNNGNTALVATVTGNSTGTFSDTTHTVSVSAGDLIVIQASSATTGTTIGSITVRFTPS